MSPECRIALKEWAVVEKALAQGKQTLLLKKGGLLDGPSGFKTEHPSFYIFPTFHHQQRDGIKPEFEGLLKTLPWGAQSGGEVKLSLYVEVRKTLFMKEAGAVLKLESHHIFNSGEVKHRFNSGKHAGIHVLLLNVYKLVKPVCLPFSPLYSGCRSWVELGKSIRGGEARLVPATHLD